MEREEDRDGLLRCQAIDVDDDDVWGNAPANKKRPWDSPTQPNQIKRLRLPSEIRVSEDESSSEEEDDEQHCDEIASSVKVVSSARDEPRRAARVVLEPPLRVISTTMADDDDGAMLLKVLSKRNLECTLVVYKTEPRQQKNAAGSYKRSYRVFLGGDYWFLVETVSESGALHKAGVRPGDYITKINDADAANVRDVKEFRERLGGASAKLHGGILTFTAAFTLNTERVIEKVVARHVKRRRYIYREHPSDHKSIQRLGARFFERVCVEHGTPIKRCERCKYDAENPNSNALAHELAARKCGKVLKAVRYIGDFCKTFVCANEHRFTLSDADIAAGKWCEQCVEILELEREQQRLLMAARSKHEATTGVPNPDAKNVYECLGVSRGATTAHIKKVYRQLALRHHPDKCKNSTKDATRMFLSYTNAYKSILAARGNG